MIAFRSAVSDVTCTNSQDTLCDTFRKLQSRLSDFVLASCIGMTDADILSCLSCHNTLLCLMQEFTSVF